MMFLGSAKLPHREMSMKYIAIIFSLCLTSFEAMAIGNIWVEPSNPTTNDIIEIHVELAANEPYLAGYFLESGGTIRLELMYPNIPIIPPDYARVEIYEYGKLPSGSYNFEFYTGIFPVADTYISSQSVTVTAATQPSPIPTLSQAGYILLILALIAISGWRIRRSGIMERLYARAR